MTVLDLLIARTQRNITYAYWFLFTVALVALMFLPKPLDESIRTLLITMLSVLGTLITQQSSFWFARQRSAGVPDPSTTTVTSSTETVTTPSKPTGAPNETTSPIEPPASPAADPERV